MSNTGRQPHSIKKVVLLGADGTLGAFILPQLLKGDFEVTVLKRAGSSSPDSYPSSVKVVKVDDAFAEDELVDKLQGQDAIVLSIKGSQIDLQKRIANACVKAGVKRLIPADFGSCDSSTQQAQDLVPLFKDKTQLRGYLMDLAEQHSDFTWTALVTGHLFDWADFMKIYPAEHKIAILDDGQHKASYSTRDRVGEATRHVLERPERTANKVLFVQSFSVTQNEIVSACERATNSKWTVEKLNSTDFEAEWVAKGKKGDKEYVDNLVWMLGVIDGDWPKKDGFAMDLLELKDQDLNNAIGDMLK